MSGPDLYVFTLKFLALKKLVFPHKKYFPNFFWLLFTFILCNFSTNFLSIKTLKNGPQKLLIIGPNPFISQSSPDHSPQPRIDFSYYEISGPDICSLICEANQSAPGFFSSYQLPYKRNLVIFQKNLLKKTWCRLIFKEAPGFLSRFHQLLLKNRCWLICRIWDHVCRMKKKYILKKMNAWFWENISEKPT
jgi:hypothetical protein